FRARMPQQQAGQQHGRGQHRRNGDGHVSQPEAAAVHDAVAGAEWSARPLIPLYLLSSDILPCPEAGGLESRWKEVGVLVEVFSDTVCPWCYVGKHRFE